MDWQKSDELCSWAMFVDSEPGLAFVVQRGKCEICGRDMAYIEANESEENRVCEECGPTHFLGE